MSKDFDENQLREDLEQIAAQRPTAQEIEDRFGYLQQDLVALLGEKYPPKKLSDRIFELSEKVKFSFADGMELVDEFLRPSMVLTSTRGATAPEREAERPPARRFSAISRGSNAIGKLTIERQDIDKVRFSFSLFDEDNSQIDPFFLSAKTLEGESLLERYKADDHPVVISEVAMDNYVFTLEDEAGTRRVEMGVTAAAD